MTDGERDALAVATLESIQRIIAANLPQLRAAALEQRRVGKEDAPTQAFHVGQSVRIRRSGTFRSGVNRGWYACITLRDRRTVGKIRRVNNDTGVAMVDFDEDYDPYRGLNFALSDLEPADTGAEASLAVGMRVKVKHTGSLFYGVTGVIVSELDGEPHGWHVEFEGGSASYVDADLERLPAPVSELDAAKAALSALLDDMGEAEWSSLSLDLTRQVTAVLGMGNDKTRRWLEMLARETEDEVNHDIR